MKLRNQLLRYTIPQFCEVTGTSRSMAYERIRRGELKIVKDGRLTFVTAEEAVRYAGASLPEVWPNRTEAAQQRV
jgi:hypothetical protein